MPALTSLSWSVFRTQGTAIYEHQEAFFHGETTQQLQRFEDGKNWSMATAATPGPLRLCTGAGAQVRPARVCYRFG